MSSSAQMLLSALQLTNALMGLARELRVSYAELAEVMQRAEDEGREVTVEDLDGLRTSAHDKRESLRDAIERAKQEGKV